MPNTPKDLMAFFSTPEKPVKAAEFMSFWKDLSTEEKEYYQNAPLS